MAHALAQLRLVPWRVKLAALGCVLVAAALLALALALTRDARVPLFATPLRSEQVMEVETRLAAWRIPFAPSSDGVRVDPQRRADLLLRLALAGVPHAHLAGSSEALAHVGALTPQVVLEAQTREALAAIWPRLARLDGVADARVIVAAGARRRR